MQRKRVEPNAHDALLLGRLRNAILREERHGTRLRFALREDFDALAPALALAVIDFPQIEHMTLDDLPAGHAFVFDDAPVMMLLAILEPFAAAQKHDGAALWTSFRAWE